MATADDVLPAFNLKLEFKEAYEYTKPEQVIDLMQKVIESPKDHGVQDKWQEPEQNHLKNIHVGIEGLRLGGALYKEPEPPQHTWRARESGALCLKQFPFPGHQISNVWDLVATFLSLAPAPIGATRANFYLPWTIICKRWGDKFVNKKDKKGKYPAMFQCTWRTEQMIEKEGETLVRKKLQSRFVIGVSLSGYVWQSGWVDKVRQARFAQLSKNGRWDGFIGTYEYGISPKFEKDGKAGWNFGNCAETHPFLELMHNASYSERDRCYGFAVKPPKIAQLDGKPYEPLEASQLTEPCLNCEYMISNVYLGREDHFDPKDYLSDPPPPPPA